MHKVVVGVDRSVDVRWIYLLLLLDLFHEDGLLLVLAALVLEPDADDARREARHFDQLFLHQRVRTGIGGVAGAQCVQLFLVQNSPHSGRFAIGSSTASATHRHTGHASTSVAFASSARSSHSIRSFLTGRGCRYASIGTVCLFIPKSNISSISSLFIGESFDDLALSSSQRSILSKSNMKNAHG